MDREGCTVCSVGAPLTGALLMQFFHILDVSPYQRPFKWRAFLSLTHTHTHTHAHTHTHTHTGTDTQTHTYHIRCSGLSQGDYNGQIVYISMYSIYNSRE